MEHEKSCSLDGASLKKEVGSLTLSGVLASRHGRMAGREVGRSCTETARMAAALWRTSCSWSERVRHPRLLPTTWGNVVEYNLLSESSWDGVAA